MISKIEICSMLEDFSDPRHVFELEIKFQTFDYLLNSLAAGSYDDTHLFPGLVPVAHLLNVSGDLQKHLCGQSSLLSHVIDRSS